MNLATERRRAGGPAGRGGSVTIATTTYASSIDSGITGLIARYSYAAGQRNRPILLVLHPFSGSHADIGTATMTRFAQHGFFAIAPDLRGGGASPGASDMSAREMHDAWDAVAWVRANHADKVHPTRNAWVGYSDGGGKALCALAKFPDLFSSYTDHFGISSYTDWHAETGTLFQDYLETAIGGDPATYPNRYLARDPRQAAPYILALRGGDQPGPFLQMLHDTADTTVLPHHSADVATACAASPARFRHTVTTNDVPSTQRANHGTPGPDDGGFPDAGVTYCERYWVPRALQADAWLMPPTGTVLVKGFLRSRSGWAVWLGATGGANPKTDSNGGQEQVALVSYNIPARTFTVTPQTGTMNVRCEIGASSATQNVTSATEIAVPA